MVEYLDRSNNYWYTIDGWKIKAYIKIKAINAQMKIRDYYKDVIGIPYDSMFPVLRSWRISKKNKEKLDAVYGWDVVYLKMIWPRIVRGFSAVTKKVKKRLDFSQNKGITNVVKDG